MKTSVLSLLFAGLVAAGFPLDAAAQAGPGGGPRKAVDCSKARAPERCQARQTARAACQDKQGPAHRQCVEEHMPPPDCSKSPNPQRCTEMQAARMACKDKTGPAHRQCMREHAKGPGPAQKP
jgi:hypothetical protein